MSKDEVKTTYTAANGFAMPTTVKAKTMTEEVHPNCGTPACCGKCSPSTEKLKDNHPLKGYEDNHQIDEEFTRHCEQCCKGRAM